MYTAFGEETDTSPECFWFKLDEEGREQRLQLLRKAIKMIE
jgi:hypothetical protein